MMSNDINIYGIMLLLSILSNVIITIYVSKKHNIFNQYVLYLVMYEVLGIILGGKYYSYLVNYSKFKNYDFFGIGFSSCGSLIGLFLMCYIYVKQFKEKDTIKYVLTTSVPLMYAIGKVGCFLSGCCIGFKYSGLFSVNYDGISYFPVQLLETIVFGIIFIYMYYLNKKEDKYIFSKCLIICGLSKFLLEFLRLRENNLLLNVNQVFCLVLFLIGLVFIFKDRVVKLNI